MSMNENKIIDIYTDILSYAGVSVDTDGFLFTMYDDKKEQIRIDGKALVLPTREHLKTSDINTKIIFHPLQENLMSEVSSVVNLLTKTITVRLNYIFVALATSLLELASSPAEHQKLSPEQLELIILLGEVDATTVRNFVSLFTNALKNNEEGWRYFIKIFLRRRGTIDGKVYPRAAIINFPLYEKIINKPESDEFKRLRSKDLEIFKKLFEFMLPKSGVTSNYNYGSESNTAPFLHALFKGTERIASNFNDITTQFTDFISMPEKLIFNSDWVETFDNLDEVAVLIRRIPPQAGNEGLVDISKPVLSAPTITNNQPVFGNNQSSVTFNKPVAEVKTKSGGLDFNSIVNALPPVVNPFDPMQQFMMQQRQMPLQNTVPGFLQGGMQPNMNMGFNNNPNFNQNNNLPGFTQGNFSNSGNMNMGLDPRMLGL